ncbi:permease prefix domain 2-containing transporter [Fibrella arboris]|uniref:permease prefix domain 2-containing transporter n=1 Tax=Fibrella arboris TaxID=3242486 RepID=UPI0035227E01
MGPVTGAAYPRSEYINPNLTPPRAADQLVSWFVAPHRREEVLGDLHEEFGYQVERIGESRARWRYWWDVLGFFKPRFVRRPKPTYSFSNTTDMLRNYLKIAFRNLVKYRLFSLINMLGLSLAIPSALMALIQIVNYYEYANFHHDSDRYCAGGCGLFFLESRPN